MIQQATNVLFAIPRAQQRRGGIDLAINGISDSITDQRTHVHRCEELEDIRHVDVTHFHGLWQPNHARVYRHCQKNNIPYVVSPHGMLEPWAFNHRRWKKLPYFWFRERRHLSRANAVVATSEMERESILRLVPNANVRVIPLGLDASAKPNYSASRKELGIASSKNVILYLSRIDRKKALDVLVEALVAFPEKDTLLLIVGDGDKAYEKQIQKFITKHQDDLPEVRWVGPVWGDDRWKYLQAADVLALPTKSENFGFVVLEALWVGTTVLTTIHTPWKDYARGCGVEICESNVDSVRSSLKVLAQAPSKSDEDRDRISMRCREQFHWERLQKQYNDAYQQAMEDE